MENLSHKVRTQVEIYPSPNHPDSWIAQHYSDSYRHGRTDSLDLNQSANQHTSPAPSIVLSPNPVSTTDILTATVTTTGDVDGDTITNTYAWYEDSVLTALTGSTVPASELDVGETWTI